MAHPVIKILELRENAETQDEHDYAEILIETLRDLPYEASIREFFVNAEDEKSYLTSISLIIDLASDLEVNRGLIASICSTFDNYQVKSDDGSPHVLYTAISQMLQPRINYLQFGDFGPVHVLEAQRVARNAIIAIKFSQHKGSSKRAADLFDRYIMSLAITGKERALGCHASLTKLGRRKADIDTPVIQSILSPEFSMKTFLTRGPISMFFGYIEPIRDELIKVMCDLETEASKWVFENDWYRLSAWRYSGMIEHGEKTMRAIMRVQGFPRGHGRHLKLVKKMYPKETLCLTHMFIRPI